MTQDWRLTDEEIEAATEAAMVGDGDWHGAIADAAHDKGLRGFVLAMRERASEYSVPGLRDGDVDDRDAARAALLLMARDLEALLPTGMNGGPR